MNEPTETTPAAAEAAPATEATAAQVQTAEAAPDALAPAVDDAAAVITPEVPPLIAATPPPPPEPENATIAAALDMVSSHGVEFEWAVEWACRNDSSIPENWAVKI